MKNIYFIPLLLATLAPTAYADDGKIIYDVSGRNGNVGHDGRDGDLRERDRADSGSNGDNGTPGESAGTIDAEIGFVPGTDQKQIFIKGMRRDSPSSRPSSFEDHVPASSLDSIVFSARGGIGGNGGHGGNGERGQNGHDGASRNFGMSPFFLNGDNGEDGQSGGNGGNGGVGGNGGNAGTLNIKLAPGAELLAPFVHLSTSPGRSGNPGSAGMGGSGGTGGDGGHGVCEDNTISFGWDKPVVRDDGTSATIHCGRSGDSGRQGLSGSSGSNAPRGTDGAEGYANYAYTDGKPVDGGYELKVRNFVMDEKVPDGVIEPKESLRVNGVVFENTGKAPVPAANYSVDLAGSKHIVVPMQELASGAKVEVKLPQPVEMEAAATGTTSIPVSVRLNTLSPDLKRPAPMHVQQPVQIINTSNLTLTSKKRDGEITFTVKNRSDRSYGADGELGRAVKIQLNASSANPPLVEVSPGVFKPLNDQVNLDIPSIAAGEMKVIHLRVKTPDDWKAGQEFDLRSSLSIQGSKVAPEAANPAHVAYQTDRNDTLSKVFSVKKLGVSCQYYKSLWFNYNVAAVSVEKPENAAYIDVKVQLADQKDGPVYRIALADVPKGFLDNVLRNKPFDSNQLIDFLQNVNLPNKKRTTWNIRSCSAPTNVVGDADPQDYAAESASQVNFLNMGNRSDDGRMIQDRSNGQKTEVHGQSNQTDDSGEVHTPHSHDAR